MFKTSLNDKQFSCLKMIGYDKIFYVQNGSAYAGLNNVDDVLVSHIVNVEIPNQRTELASFVVPDNTVSILEQLNVTKLLQNGQAEKEVVIEIEVDPVTDGFPPGISAGEYSFLTTAGVQSRDIAVAPALEAGSTIRLFGTAIQGTSAEASFELRVLRIGE